MRGADACSAQTALRSDWRLAGFIHFCRLFADALQISSFPAERLERAILLPHQEIGFLNQLLSAFLGKADWQNGLAQKLKRQWKDFFAENPLVDGTFFDLEPPERVRYATYWNQALRQTSRYFCNSSSNRTYFAVHERSLLSCMDWRSGGCRNQSQ